MASSIAVESMECQNAFAKCAVRVELSPVAEWLENRHGDFNLWANTLQATSLSRASLDHRLRDYPDLKSKICGLLATLVEALNQLIEITDQKLVIETEIAYHEAPQRSRVRTSYSYSNSVDAESGSDDSEPSTDEEDEDGPYSEVMDNIDVIIRELIRIGAEIRKSGSRYRFAKADSTLQPRDFEDLRDHLVFMIHLAFRETESQEHGVVKLTSGFENLTVVQQRLVQANIIRRNRMEYAYQRLQKRLLLERPRMETPDDTTENFQALVQKSTEVSQTSRPQATPVETPARQHSGTVTPSQTLPARSISTTASAIGSKFNLDLAMGKKTRSTNTKATGITKSREYPRCPSPGSQNVLQCSYCGDMLDIAYTKDESRWKGHVAQDLLPYTCIFEDCNDGEQMYITSDDLSKHILKEHGTPRWTCDLCKGATTQAFTDATGWEDHMARTHPDTFPLNQLPILSELNKTMMIPPIECPLCPFSSDQASFEVHKDITEHLHDFALRSLPWSLDKEKTSNYFMPSAHSASRSISTDMNDELVEGMQDDFPGSIDIWIGSLSEALLQSYATEKAEKTELVSPILQRLDGVKAKYGNTNFTQEAQQDIWPGLLNVQASCHMLITNAQDLSPSEIIMTRENLEAEFDLLLRQSEVATERQSLPAKIVDSGEHTSHLGTETTLRTVLQQQSDTIDTEESLSRVIDAAATAVESTSHDDPELARKILYLGLRLIMRFQKTGALSDLDHAIDIITGGADCTLDDNPHRGRLLHFLAHALVQKHQTIDTMDNANAAIDILTRAIESSSHDKYEYAIDCFVLGQTLYSRFQKTGAIGDLDNAIESMMKAADTSHQDMACLADLPCRLGTLLTLRYEELGDSKNLDKAVAILTRAARTGSQSDFDIASRSSLLARCLGLQFQRSNLVMDLEYVVREAERALRHTPRDDPSYSKRCDQLAGLFGLTYKSKGTLDDLEKAIEVATVALGCESSKSDLRPIFARNLATLLIQRFDVLDNMPDLEQAIYILESTLANPLSIPDRQRHCTKLATYLEQRFRRFGNQDDLQRSLLLYLEAWNAQAASSTMRVRAAENAAQIYARRQDWENASRLLFDAALLLPQVSRESLHPDISLDFPMSEELETASVSLSHFCSFAAAAALNAHHKPEQALDILEKNPNMTTGFPVDTRGDIARLKLQHPGLADQLLTLQEEIDSPSESHTLIKRKGARLVGKAQHRQWHQADLALSKLIEAIRKEPGFGSFLKSPTSEEMMAAARAGPIIVLNFTVYRSDAFLIEQSRIGVIQLPGLSEESLRYVSNQFQYTGLVRDPESALAVLWKIVCRPCLDALGFTSSPVREAYPRVWWIPTGPLTDLPLHAAGLHHISTETVLDTVLSSYATSVKALLHGRQLSSRSNRTQRKSAIFIERGIRGLSSNQEEVKTIENLSPLLSLETVTLPRPDRLRRRRPLLPQCAIYHCADRETAFSIDLLSVLLSGWDESLRLEDLRRGQLQNTLFFLAYLSTNLATDYARSDLWSPDSIHIPSAYKVAGFRNVVAAHWAVSDEHYLHFATTIYKTLAEEGMTDYAVCQGLHRAARLSRDSSYERGLVSIDWASFVHFGV